MASAIAQKRISPVRKTQTPITWEAFQRRYLTREDGFKYEWVNGFVEKTTRSMDKSQAYIQVNLMLFLLKLKAMKPKIDGYFIVESDSFFAKNHRRPDIAYYSAKAIIDARAEKDIQVDFVIEVLSKTDQINRVEQKMEDYEKAGVKVVWHIFPQFKKVHVYHGNKMTVCRGADLCSAEPVIEGFLMPATEIFI